MKGFFQLYLPWLELVVNVSMGSVIIIIFIFRLVVFQNCKELIASVEETGSIMREIRDLEDQV